MGYNITIGNAVPEFRKEDGELYAAWVVNHAESDDAPTFPHDEVTGKSNSRSPSYSGWSDFCAEAGLEDMWYHDYSGFLRKHPGCFPLEKHHHTAVKAALERWQTKATKPPGFAGWSDEDKGKYDPILARLIWLEWWMAWALESCETPAVWNT
jgi:hypothetical protein